MCYFVNFIFCVNNNFSVHLSMTIMSAALQHDNININIMLILLDFICDLFPYNHERNWVKRNWMRFNALMNPLNASMRSSLVMHGNLIERTK
jgi:hypothetical protein